jgi:hypothetical protein
MKLSALSRQLSANSDFDRADGFNGVDLFQP